MNTGVRTFRPCNQYKNVRTCYENTKIDVVLVRENTEDLYAGVEFEAGKSETAKLVEFINSIGDKRIRTGANETGVWSNRSAFPARSGSHAAR